MPNGIFAGVAVHDVDLASRRCRACSATTCGKVVSCPWPWLCEPVKTEIEPVAFTRTVALS